MGLSLRNGDYVPDGTGGLRRTEGREALLEQVLFRLTARRGTFPIPAGAGEPAVAAGTAARRQTAERGGTICGGGPGGGTGADGGAGDFDGIRRRPGHQVTVGLTWQGEALSVTVEVS